MVVTRTTRNRFVQRWARGFESHHLRHQTESGRNSRSRLFFIEMRNSRFSQSKLTTLPTRLSLDAIRVPGSFFIEMSGSRFSQSKRTRFPTRLSMDAVRVPSSFFIKMSSSRFSQSKLTLLPNGVFPEQKPHKKSDLQVASQVGYCCMIILRIPR